MSRTLSSAQACSKGSLRHSPEAISVSLGYDLSAPDPGRRHLASLPNGLVALQAEIQAAVRSRIVVVFSAGNGHVSFPGMMPEVISAGGAFVDEDGGVRASDCASAFASRIYPARDVPDFCGLVGLAADHADCVMLPIPPGCEIARSTETTRSTTERLQTTDGACSVERRQWPLRWPESSLCCCRRIRASRPPTSSRSCVAPPWTPRREWRTRRATKASHSRRRRAGTAPRLWPRLTRDRSAPRLAVPPRPPASSAGRRASRVSQRPRPSRPPGQTGLRSSTKLRLRVGDRAVSL